MHLVERPFGGRPQPNVPGDLFRDRLGGKTGIGFGTKKVDALNHSNLTDAAIADQLTGKTIHLHRSLLGAGLDDAVVSPSGLDQCPAFGNVHRHRLLAVDVLAGLACQHAGLYVVDVHGTDDHGVEVFSVQQLAVVLVSLPVRLVHLSAAAVQRRSQSQMAVSLPSDGMLLMS